MSRIIFMPESRLLRSWKALSIKKDRHLVSPTTCLKCILARKNSLCHNSPHHQFHLLCMDRHKISGVPNSKESITFNSKAHSSRPTPLKDRCTQPIWHRQTNSSCNRHNSQASQTTIPNSRWVVFPTRHLLRPNPSISNHRTCRTST